MVWFYEILCRDQRCHKSLEHNPWGYVRNVWLYKDTRNPIICMLFEATLGISFVISYPVDALPLLSPSNKNHNMTITLEVEQYRFRGAMGVQHVGSFLILSASAQSLTPTLKLICSLLIFFVEKITHKLIDQSKTSGSGRESCEFRELGTNQRAAPP